MKKLLSVILAMAIVFSLCACGKEPETVVEEPKTRDIVLSLDISNINSLDVYSQSDDGVFQISASVFDTLYCTDPETDEIVPLLAESMPEISEDGLTYTFSIKNDVKWADGTSLSLTDVKYSFYQLFSPEKSGINAPYLSSIISGVSEYMNGEAETIEGIVFNEDGTISITLKESSSSFISLLASPMFPILPEAKRTQAGEEWGKTSVLEGSGPFKVTSFKQGEEIILVPNENYRGTVPDCEHLIIRNMKPADAYAAFEEGEVDFFLLNSEQIDAASAAYPDNVHDTVVDTAVKLSINVMKTPQNNELIRKAIAYGIDTKQIVENYYKNKVAPLYTLIPRGVRGSNKLKTESPTNIEYAKQLLADASYPDGITADVAIIDTDTESAFVIQMIADQLAEADINLNVIKYDSAVYQEKKQSGQLEMTISRVSASYNDPYQFITGQFHSSVSINRSICLQSEEFDKKTEDIKNSSFDTEPDTAKDVDEYLCREIAAAVPLYQLKTFYMLSDNAKGIFVGKDGLVHIENAVYTEVEPVEAK